VRSSLSADAGVMRGRNRQTGREPEAAGRRGVAQRELAERAQVRVRGRERATGAEDVGRAAGGRIRAVRERLGVARRGRVQAPVRERVGVAEREWARGVRRATV